MIEESPDTTGSRPGSTIQRASPSAGSSARSDEPGPSRITTTHSPSFVRILSELRVSLLVSTYQTGKLAVVQVRGEELLITYHNFDRPMGIALSRVHRDRHQYASLVHPGDAADRARHRQQGQLRFVLSRTRFPLHGRDSRARTGVVGTRALGRQHAFFVPLQSGQRPQFHPQVETSVRDAPWPPKTGATSMASPSNTTVRAIFLAWARPIRRGAGNWTKRLGAA